jgi:hypothetical protein
MDQTWLNIYRNFDDDALAALASAGLVRRAAKDVEAGKVAWESPPGPKQGLLRADGQLVSISADGPAKASCDCPAPEICKHILAATIWLRNSTASDQNEVTADVLAEVLALDPAAVFKAAGLAATRKAAAMYAGCGTAMLTSLPGALLIQVPDMDITCRYISDAGFTGMVSEAPAASRATMHMLAITAIWRLHGRDFSWPAAVAAMPAISENILTDAERQFLDRLRQLILEACRSGWAHVSEVMPTQLRSFAMSARVESFPRLAGMLRTLAGTTELLVKDDLSADERQAIRLAARIHALCHALEQSSGDVLRELRGRAQRLFDGNQALELLPLGAHWWEQRGGARGLTISFWDHASLSVMQTVLARRDASDTGFSRADAWSYHTLWQGAGPAQTLAGGALMLEDVRVSSDGRLSLSGETRARVLPPWSASDKRWSAAGYDDWSELAGAIRMSAGLRGETIACVLLKPSAVDTPQLDEIRQIARWQLRDKHGVPLLLRLSCESRHHQRLENIAAWVAAGIPIKAVLARLERDMDGGTLEPVSLIVESNGVLRSVALDYEAPASSSAPTLMRRIARMLQSRPLPVAQAPHSAHLEWIDTLLLILENKGMTGRLHLIGEDRTSLMAVQQFTRATGLDVLADAVEHYLSVPEASKALMLHYLCQTCMELDTGFLNNCQ